MDRKNAGYNRNAVTMSYLKNNIDGINVYVRVYVYASKLVILKSFHLYTMYIYYNKSAITTYETIKSFAQAEGLNVSR